MPFPLHRWIRVTLFNLFLVAFIGVILRYKIAFALPFVDQKHLQHGHSHFAFAGWITQVLMVLLVWWLARRAPAGQLKKYSWLLLINLLTAYGMLVAFVLEGYGMFSIILSTIFVFVSYIFGVCYWRDLLYMGRIQCTPLCVPHDNLHQAETKDAIHYTWRTS